MAWSTLCIDGKAFHASYWSLFNAFKGNTLLAKASGSQPLAVPIPLFNKKQYSDQYSVAV